MWWRKAWKGGLRRNTSAAELVPDLQILQYCMFVKKMLLVPWAGMVLSPRLKQKAVTSLLLQHFPWLLDTNGLNGSTIDLLSGHQKPTRPSSVHRKVLSRTTKQYMRHPLSDRRTLLVLSNQLFFLCIANADEVGLLSQVYRGLSRTCQSEVLAVFCSLTNGRKALSQKTPQ